MISPVCNILFTIKQCCGSGMFIPKTRSLFFHSRSRIHVQKGIRSRFRIRNTKLTKSLSILNSKHSSGCLSQIRKIFPSRIRIRNTAIKCKYVFLNNSEQKHEWRRSFWNLQDLSVNPLMSKLYVKNLTTGYIQEEEKFDKNSSNISVFRAVCSERERTTEGAYFLHVE